MNITTALTEFEDIYDAVQTGEIDAKMGDTINGAFLMVNGYHLEPLASGPYFIFEETVKNHSTGVTFTERYIAPAPCPLPPSKTHLETLSVTQSALEI